MYRKLLSCCAVALAVLSMVVLPATAYAQQSKMTEQYIEKIRAKCIDAQVMLQRVQYSDVVTRINRGQSYDELMSKLIAPFNSRVALNRLPQSTSLVEKTTSIETALAAFRKDYVVYEDTLSDTLDIRCQDAPVTFYDSLSRTRELRAKLAADIQAIKQSIDAYKNEVAEIQKTIARKAQ